MRLRGRPAAPCWRTHNHLTIAPMRLCGRPAAPCWRAPNHLTMAPMRLRGRRGRARGACAILPRCRWRLLPAAPCWCIQNHLTMAPMRPWVPRRAVLGSQDCGAGVARAWRRRGAGYRPFFCLGWRERGAGMARAWRGHVL
eukprot:gene11502-biopygen7863